MNNYLLPDVMGFFIDNGGVHTLFEALNTLFIFRFY